MRLALESEWELALVLASGSALALGMELGLD
jgi:hypothetical protein